MILYLDRSWSAMIYPLDRSRQGHGVDIQDNLNIDKQIIHNLAHLLYSNVKRSCFRHPLCDLSQDRQLEGQSQKLPYFVAASQWNDLTAEIRLSPTIDNFKNIIKNLLFQQYHLDNTVPAF